MRNHLLPLLCASLATLAHAAEPAAPAKAEASATAEPLPYKIGDRAPANLLPTVWLRGEPVKAFEPGVTYVMTMWNTSGGHSYAPGYNIERTMRRYAADPRIRTVVVFLMDDLAPEKLARRLARPSQQTPFPVAHATPGSDCEKAYARLFSPTATGAQGRKNTLIIRDGIIVWTGEAANVTRRGLDPLLQPDFKLDEHVKREAAANKRTRELINLLMSELPEAEKAKDDAKVQNILQTLEQEPNLDSFVYTRLRDTKCGMAMEKGDMDGAVAEMRKLSDKYPDEAPTQSWVHKVIAGTDELYKPGLDLAAVAAERMTRIPEVDNPSAWWQAVAKYRMELGDKKAALAALENAQRTSAAYRRLETMKKAAN